MVAKQGANAQSIRRPTTASVSDHLFQPSAAVSSLLFSSQSHPSTVTLFLFWYLRNTSSILDRTPPSPALHRLEKPLTIRRRSSLERRFGQSLGAWLQGSVRQPPPALLVAPSQNGLPHQTQPSVINKENNDDKEILDMEASDYSAIAEKLGKEADTSWENSKAKQDRQPLKLFLMNLKDVVSLWQHFICAHIITGGNTSVVTKERAFLLYCIVTGQQVDVAEIMMNQVVQAAE
ncbi:hypothetical protein G2W53_004093 [Senna tora]|uniref:Uncharacterized protein n=1 Tax=Senna tora TaxID=362788 RepID=A0A834XB55_9FABA|nr:hypothetical protein G2W53_004093 [Senna tora]